MATPITIMIECAAPETKLNNPIHRFRMKETRKSKSCTAANCDRFSHPCVLQLPDLKKRGAAASAPLSKKNSNRVRGNTKSRADHLCIALHASSPNSQLRQTSFVNRSPVLPEEERDAAATKRQYCLAQVLQLRQVFRPSLHVRVVETEKLQVLQLRQVFRPDLLVRVVETE